MALHKIDLGKNGVIYCGDDGLQKFHDKCIEVYKEFTIGKVLYKDDKPVSNYTGDVQEIKNLIKEILEDERQ